jgi:hypothetical protein
MSTFFCVVLSCTGGVLPMGRSPVQGTLPKCLTELVVSEVNYEPEQARRPNPRNVQQPINLVQRIH